MKKLILLLLLSLISIESYGVEIASCSNPKGKAFYLNYGMVNSKSAGWEENEKITNGLFKLTKSGKDDYDIVFVDASKKFISSKEDGGKILVLNRGDNLISFLVIYLGKTAEIYTFLKNSSGKNEFVMTTNRGGDLVTISKASVMVGECDYIDFGKL